MFGVQQRAAPRRPAIAVKGVNLAYAQHYKRKYSHIGYFWQDRDKSIIISKDEYLFACGSYQ